MANTPPRPPIENRESDELLDDLCIGLRHVGCGDYDLLRNPGPRDSITTVKSIANELAKRGIDPHPRIDELSTQTGWKMDLLFADCIEYPTVLPFVRETDGIRRALRCQLCGKNEFHVAAKIFFFCDDCLRRVIASIQSRTPIEGILLFRTFNTDSRCKHADDDTVLAATLDYDGYLIRGGACEVCITEELNERNGKP